VGFVTGCHMANFTALAAARHELLRRAGWDVEGDGLQAAPRLRVIVGDEVHVSVVGALRMLGIGSRQVVRVAADDQGRLKPEALDAALAGGSGPTIVCAQAGNVNSGAFDPLDAIADLTSRHQAWLHVDGAFGLWAAASAALQHHVHGIERADSWATDAHKWLNVPYDSGLVFVAHPSAHRAAMSQTAAYLSRSAGEPREPMDLVPESSRRARGFSIYAALRGSAARGAGDPDPERRRAEPGAGPRRAAVRRRGRRDARCAAARPGGARLLARRHALARHGGDADLGVQLVDERRGRRSL